MRLARSISVRGQPPPITQGQTLCAALEPIVDVLRPGAPELDLTDLAATAADGLDVLSLT